MRSFTCVLVVVYATRKLRPCPSYSRRRDRIDLGLWCSLYKGGGVLEHCTHSCAPLTSADATFVHFCVAYSHTGALG